MIQIDYNQAIRKAEDLNLQGKELSAVIQRLENQQKILCSSWEGPASETFRYREENLMQEMKRICTSIIRCADSIEETVYAIKRRDEEIARLTNRL